MSLKIDIVIGANFGDEGKGRTVNYLATKDSLVILSNGGAQRGHTVIQDATKHIFHHFGSGTLKGAFSYASKYFILNPLQFRKEYEELKEKGITPKLYADPRCRISTPFDMLTNILRSEKAGEYSSTGFGIWETILRYQDRNFLSYDFLTLSLLSHADLNKHLERIKKYYSESAIVQESNSNTKKLITDPNLIIDNFIDDLKFMFDNVEIKSFKDIYKDYNHIIFEQGQGLGLDKDYDIDFGTPSYTGSTIPSYILKNSDIDLKNYDITKYYITRSYLSRHGAGKLIGEDPSLKFLDETNKFNDFQGNIRFALFSDMTIQDMLNRIEKDKNIITGSNILVITQEEKTKIKSLNILSKEFNSIIHL